MSVCSQLCKAICRLCKSQHWPFNGNFLQQCAPNLLRIPTKSLLRISLCYSLPLFIHAFSTCLPMTCTIPLCCLCFNDTRFLSKTQLIISCVLLKNLVSLYYQRNYEPLQYHCLCLYSYVAWTPSTTPSWGIAVLT